MNIRCQVVPSNKYIHCTYKHWFSKIMILSPNNMPNYFKNFQPYPAQRIGISAVIYMHTYIYIIISHND